MNKMACISPLLVENADAPAMNNTVANAFNITVTNAAFDGIFFLFPKNREKKRPAE